MVGSVTGYAKQHTYLGSPEIKQELPKKRNPVKVIRPKKIKSIQYIQIFNKAT